MMDSENALPQAISKSAVVGFFLAIVFPIAILGTLVWTPSAPVWLPICIATSPFLAIFLGHFSLKSVAKSRGGLRGGQLGRLALYFAYPGAALIICALLFFHPEDHKQAYAADAVGSIRILDEAAKAYGNSHPEKGFPENITALASDYKGDEFNVSRLQSIAEGHRSCYRFVYSAKSSRGGGGSALDAFEVTADPVCPGTAYLRHFYSDQTGVIRFSKNARANAQSPPLG